MFGTDNLIAAAAVSAMSAAAREVGMGRGCQRDGSQTAAEAARARAEAKRARRLAARALNTNPTTTEK